MATRDSKTADLGKFPLGINNVSPETDLPEGSLRSAINVNLDKEGNVLRREGYTEVYSSSNIHSLYSNYFAEGSILKELDTTAYTTTNVDTGLSANNYLAWETILGSHYYSDGTRNRIVDAKGWGVETPANNPSLTRTSGMLEAGTYQVSVGFVDTSTGEEGGSLLATTITVPDDSGILCSNIPISVDDHDAIIYVSTQNGEQLYQNAIVTNGLTNYTIINSRKSTRILNTQFMTPLPGGHILRHFKARLYVARSNVLWFSESFRYGLCKTAKDFFQFPTKITVVQPVEDGIFVVADKTYFLQGTEPKYMKQVVVSKDSGIEGTGLTSTGGIFGFDTDTTVGYWFSDKGAVVGLPGGQIKQLTEDRLALEEGLLHGATMLKEKDGIKQMITSFDNSGTEPKFALGSQITSQIIRNGVVIP